MDYGPFFLAHPCYPLDPVTSVLPTADTQTYLVQSLDSTIRLMDAENGKLLNTFKGHVNNEYRSRACFGPAEACVISGDEDGRVWAWDLVEVSLFSLEKVIRLWTHAFVAGLAVISKSPAQGS